MLTKHLTGHRLLPATEQELQAHLEKRAHKELSKQHAAAKTAADKAAEMAEMEKALRTYAMLQYIADTTRNVALSAEATEEEANATGVTTLATARAKHQAPMQA